MRASDARPRAKALAALANAEGKEDKARAAELLARHASDADESYGCRAAALEALLPKAVDAGREWMRRCREEFQQEIRPKLQRQLAELDRLRTRRMAELERRYGPDGQLTQLIQGQKDQKRRESEQLFQDYCDWIEDTLETGETPYLQVVAVLTGGGSELN